MGSGSACMEPTGTSRSCPNDQLVIAPRGPSQPDRVTVPSAQRPARARRGSTNSRVTHRWRGPCAAVHHWVTCPGLIGLDARCAGSRLGVGSTPLLPGLVPPLRETAHVGSLAGMLHRVTNHADQPDCGCYRGVPPGVDDPIQLVPSNAIQVAQRQFVNIPVVVAKEFATHPDRRYLFRVLAVTGSPLVERQPKPFTPLRPDLLNLRQVGHLMVLAAGEVPEQPGNRVGFRIRAVGGDFVSQPIGEIDHELSHPPEGVSQNLLRMFSHITEPYWLWLRLNPSASSESAGPPLTLQVGPSNPRVALPLTWAAMPDVDQAAAPCRIQRRPKS